MSKHIGFITSWMQNEAVSEVQELSPMQTLVAGNENQVQLSPAHIECKVRIAMVESAISAPTFAKLSKENKVELLDELKWLSIVESLF